MNVMRNENYEFLPTRKSVTKSKEKKVGLLSDSTAVESDDDSMKHAVREDSGLKASDQRPNRTA